MNRLNNHEFFLTRELHKYFFKFLIARWQTWSISWLFNQVLQQPYRFAYSSLNVECTELRY